VCRQNLDKSIHGGGRSGSDKTFNLCSTKVLSRSSKVGDVNVRSQFAVFSHPSRVDPQYLTAAVLIWKTCKNRGTEDCHNIISANTMSPLTDNDELLSTQSLVSFVSSTQRAMHI